MEPMEYIAALAKALGPEAEWKRIRASDACAEAFNELLSSLEPQSLFGEVTIAISTPGDVTPIDHITGLIRGLPGDARTDGVAAVLTFKGRGVRFSVRQLALFDKALRRLYSYAKGQLSAKWLHNALLKYVVLAANGEAGVAELREDTDREITCIANFAALVPLTGIRLDGTDLELGVVRVCQGSEALAADAVAGLERVLRGDTQDDVPGWAEVRESVQRDLADGAMAFVGVRGHGPDVSRIAVWHARRTMDFLWAIVPSLGLSPDDTWFGVRGDAHRGPRTVPVIGEGRCHIDREMGVQRELVVTRDIVAFMADRGLLLLAGMSTATKPSELVIAVRRALHWFALGVQEQDIGQAYLATAVRVEALLTGRSEEVRASLSKRGAWMLGGTYDQRVAIANDLKRLYAIRSRAAHGQEIDGIMSALCDSERG